MSGGWKKRAEVKGGNCGRSRKKAQVSPLSVEGPKNLGKSEILEEEKGKKSGFLIRMGGRMNKNDTEEHVGEYAHLEIECRTQHILERSSQKGINEENMSGGPPSNQVHATGIRRRVVAVDSEERQNARGRANQTKKKSSEMGKTSREPGEG